MATPVPPIPKSGDRRLGRNRETSRLHRQLCLPRNHESGRHIRQLDLLHGERNPRDVRPGCGCHLFAGHSGDVTQVDNLSRYAYPSGEQWARLVGGRIGAEAVKVLLSMDRGGDVLLDARSNVLEMKRRSPSPEHVKRAYELVRQDIREIGRAQWAFAKETVILDALIATEPVVDVEVQAIQVGPAIYLSNPAELFCQYGLDIKAKSPFPLTWPVELANGNGGPCLLKKPTVNTAAVTRPGSRATAIWRSRRGAGW